MSAQPLRIERKEPQTIQAKGKTTRDKIEKTFTEEIVLAICAPIGSLKDKVISTLEDKIKLYNYDIQIISLSQFIIDHFKKKHEPIKGKTEAFSKLKHKIEGGNSLREEFKNRSLLAELAIKEINLDRNQAFTREGELPLATEIASRRKCYIIDSLKNKEELLLFRSIYKDLFYSFSVFSPKNERFNKLQSIGLSIDEIKELMLIDDYEDNKFGQDVRNTFVEADFFIRVSDKNVDQLSAKIERYLHIIFESNVVTPYHDEYAMYVAKSAAGNSACLSRQVGASIMSKDGIILSKGWNDVPKFQGNLYSEQDGVKDKRCFHDGFCSNDKMKDDLTSKIIDLIKEDSTFKEMWGANFDKTIGELNQLIRNSRVKDLIEFSRSVHAEMHAIITGSQVCGEKIRGSKLFTTTYPCHNCARHIIVSGITEVYYIEPYAKSLGIDLHSDAITEDEIEPNKVRLLLYDGVAPRRYLEFFSKSRDRKDQKGIKINHDLTKIGPKFKMTLQALSTLEQQAIHSLNESGFINEQQEAK